LHKERFDELSEALWQAKFQDVGMGTHLGRNAFQLKVICKVVFMAVFF
jgi:DhnA family fructose-bisphosphate aldolase class Ia